MLDEARRLVLADGCEFDLVITVTLNSATGDVHSFSTSIDHDTSCVATLTEKTLLHIAGEHAGGHASVLTHKMGSKETLN